jgi:hypothetical protein
MVTIRPTRARLPVWGAVALAEALGAAVGSLVGGRGDGALLGVQPATSVTTTNTADSRAGTRREGTRAVVVIGILGSICPAWTGQRYRRSTEINGSLRCHHPAPAVEDVGGPKTARVSVCVAR